MLEHEGKLNTLMNEFAKTLTLYQKHILEDIIATRNKMATEVCEDLTRWYESGQETSDVTRAIRMAQEIVRYEIAIQEIRNLMKK